MSDVNYLWLYQYEGRGVIDFVALCLTHIRGDLFLRPPAPPLLSLRFTLLGFGHHEAKGVSFP